MYYASAIYTRAIVDNHGLREAIEEYALTTDEQGNARHPQSQLADLDLGLGYEEPTGTAKLSAKERAWLHGAARHWRQHRTLSPAALAQARYLSANRDCVRYLTSKERERLAPQARAHDATVPGWRPSVGALFKQAIDADCEPDIPVADWREARSFDDYYGTTGEHDADDYERAIEELMFED